MLHKMNIKSARHSFSLYSLHEGEVCNELAGPISAT